jgi:hypothetical protein
MHCLDPRDGADLRRDRSGIRLARRHPPDSALRLRRDGRLAPPDHAIAGDRPMPKGTDSGCAGQGLIDPDAAAGPISSRQPDAGRCIGRRAAAAISERTR